MILALNHRASKFADGRDSTRAATVEAFKEAFDRLIKALKDAEFDDSGLENPQSELSKV